MSAQSYLDGLRSKPEHVRKRIAFWSSFGATAFIFVFWLASFTAVGSKINPQGALTRAVEKAESPAASLAASVGSVFEDIKGLFMAPKRVEFGEIEVVPGGGK